MDARAHVFSRPAPDGIADVHFLSSSAVALILDTGATWVEVVVDEGAQTTRPTLYPEGPGRYAVRLTRLQETTCQEALRAAGYDPLTLRHVGGAHYDAEQYADLDAACAAANRIGDSPDIDELVTSAIPISENHGWLGQWTAPFALIEVVSVRNPQSGASNWEDELIIERRQIIARETSAVIAEEVSLVAYVDRYRHTQTICGSAVGRGNRPFKTRVFAPSQ